MNYGDLCLVVLLSFCSALRPLPATAAVPAKPSVTCVVGSPGCAPTLGGNPATTVLACADVTPDNACDGPIGQVLVSMGYVVPTMFVSAGSSPTDCSSLGFVELALLPIGSYLCVSDYQGNPPSNGGIQPASNFTFGLGVPLSPAFSISQLDSTQMSEAFSAGFLLVGVAMATGKGISLVVSMIRS